MSRFPEPPLPGLVNPLVFFDALRVKIRDEGTLALQQQVRRNQ